MSCQNIAELIFSISEKCLIIPAHAWTPWFGIYGSKGGFDSLEEAFGSYSDHIYAIETGLSSDPEMNWRIKELGNREIVSFSDAHSPPKMGRELTFFKGSSTYSYNDIYAAIAQRLTGKNSGELHVSHTIEFYPEEGKYHWDGHRACNVVQSPAVTRKNGDICPVCGKPLTIGVEYRVDELANHEVTPEKIPDKNDVIFYHHPTDKTRAPFIKLVPLQEIISEVEQKGVSSNTVQKKYDALIEKLGDELKILLMANRQEIGDPLLAEAIFKVRRGELHIEPGYDGVYGKVEIPFERNEKVEEQEGLFLWLR